MSRIILIVAGVVVLAAAGGFFYLEKAEAPMAEVNQAQNINQPADEANANQKLGGNMGEYDQVVNANVAPDTSVSTNVNVNAPVEPKEPIEITQTAAGQVIKNNQDGYELTVPTGWANNYDKNLELSYTEETGGLGEVGHNCQLVISKYNNVYNFQSWLNDIDNQRAILEKDEPSQSKILEEKQIIFDGISSMFRSIEPPIGAIYSIIYVPSNNSVLSLEYETGSVSSEGLKKCNNDLDNILKEIKISK